MPHGRPTRVGIGGVMGRSGAPGTRVVGAGARGTWRLPRALGTDRDQRSTSLREKRRRTEDRGAFCRDGTLTRTGDVSPVRARTAAPSRRLRGGIAQERARLFDQSVTARH